MANFDELSIVNAVERVIQGAKKPVSLHEPVFRGNETAYLRECIETGWVSSVGPFVDRFERMLEKATGAPHAVVTVNGTAALHIALKLAGVVSEDEVILPALTFVATANAVAYCGATPHFADSEESTLGIDPIKLRAYLEKNSVLKAEGAYNKTTGSRIRAVIAMHTFGHPVDLDPLVSLCEEFKIELIEDAAESLGSSYKGRPTGTFGKIGTLSFNGNKVVTTGGGGALLFKDSALAKRAKHITTTARVGHTWSYEHDEVGYNYRLPNINAALGCAQLEQLEGFLERKRELAARYRSEMALLEGFKFFEEPANSHSNYWLNAILLDAQNAGSRDSLLERFHANGCLARPAWVLMHRLKMYSSCPKMDLAVAESLERRLINIPSGAGLGVGRG